MHTVIQTEAFVVAAKRAGITDDQRLKMVLHLAAHPQDGTLIPGTGGARKLRFAAKGKGKRGGARVITYYGGDDIPLFLLEVFVKGERIDISQAERNALRDTLKMMAEAYRQRQRQKIARLGGHTA